jgi:hypothetical protein
VNAGGNGRRRILKGTRISQLSPEVEPAQEAEYLAQGCP